MIKAVIFDMDGVLVDAREWHYEALNKALALFGMEIGRADHLSTFDGLPTRRKLEMLSATHELPLELHDFINALKQNYTLDIIGQRCRPYFPHEYALTILHRRDMRLGLASNSVRASVDCMMKRTGLAPYLEVMLSNEDVGHAKPHPEIYLKAMALLGVSPSETLIVEDNDHGLQAAYAAGAHVLAVRGVEDVNIDAIDRRLCEIGAAA